MKDYPRYPPAAGESEFGFMVRAHPTFAANRKLGLVRLANILAGGVICTTKVKVLKDKRWDGRKRNGWGVYFHGFRVPEVWRSWGAN